MRKLVSIFIITIIVILLISPLIFGIWFRHSYQEIISFYNSQKNLEINISEYQRGWFTSNIVLDVDVKNVNESLKNLGFSISNLPNNFHFKVFQTVTHGPFFYQNNQNLPYYFGLAALQSKIAIPKEFLISNANFGMQSETNSQMISFLGNYYQHVAIGPMFLKPNSETQINLSGIDGNLWIYPNHNKVTGSFNLKEIAISDAKNLLFISNFIINFNQYKNKHGLWIGRDKLSIPYINFHDDEQNQLIISNLHLSGFSEDNADTINLGPKLHIDRIRLNDEVLGPIDIEAVAKNFNGQAIANLINEYQQISQAGELYQNQLQIRMQQLIPLVIGSSSSVELRKFNLLSPSGGIKVNGEIRWPTESYNLPSNFREILKSGNSYLNFYISKDFAQNIIRYASFMPFFLQGAASADRKLLATTREDLDYAYRQNAILIENLLERGILTDVDAQTLLSLQKDLVPIQTYADELKKLLFTRKILLPVSYLLYWQYSQVSKPFLILENKVGQYQERVVQQLQTQVSQLLQQGYITEKNNNYLFSLTWSNGRLQINGHTQKRD